MAEAMQFRGTLSFASTAERESGVAALLHGDSCIQPTDLKTLHELVVIAWSGNAPIGMWESTNAAIGRACGHAWSGNVQATLRDEEPEVFSGHGQSRALGAKGLGAARGKSPRASKRKLLGRSKPTQVVAYAFEHRHDEPDGTTPSWVIGELADDKPLGASWPFPTEYTVHRFREALHAMIARDATLAADLEPALAWTVETRGAWILYGLEPANVAGTGVAWKNR